MDVTLHLDPAAVPMDWDTFRTLTPVRSIALDGFVADGPRFDPNGPWLNANHHENVDRLSTLATCEQILRLIRLGLTATFNDHGQFSCHVWANDCDQDVCLSWWLLDHAEDVRDHANPRLNRLVAVEGLLDTTCGAYPFGSDRQYVTQVQWVFEPYTDARTRGLLDPNVPQRHVDVVTSVCARIDAHLAGQGGALPLDERYEPLVRRTRWTLIREVGQHGRFGAFADGIDAYVAVRERGAGLWTYTIGRRSVLVPFDVAAVCAALNAVEGCVQDCWGGSDLVGGSPRVSGSRLSPEVVCGIVDATVDR